MRTVPDVLRHLAAGGREFSASPDGQLVRWQYVDPLVSMPVALRPIRSRRGSEWLAVGVPVGPVQVLRVRGALVANDELGIGALAVVEGVVTLRQTLRLGNFTGVELDHTVRALVHTSAIMVAAATATLPPNVHNPYRYLFKSP